MHWHGFTERLVILQDRRYHSCSTVGWCRDDASSCGILFIHRQRIRTDPVKDKKQVAQYAASRKITMKCYCSSFAFIGPTVCELDGPIPMV